jgi:hypothetical protein
MHFAMTQAMMLAFRSFGEPTEAMEKHYLTKLDLCSLIEFDHASAISPDNAQQHHIAWLLGFLCGVRPGAIGYSNKRRGHFLQWKDIQISRIGPAGSCNFKLTATFRWLKGHHDENRRTLKFSVSGPSTIEDVMYSLPHRILAVLIRRRYLRDHHTVRSLIDGQEVQIHIKHEAMLLPVICQAGPKGLDIFPEKALSAISVSTYMSKRAMDFGLPAHITFYAWRRSAATNVGELLGADKARAFLGHGPHSTSFEEHYDQGTVTYDVMGMAMGRRPAAAAVVMQDENLTVNRIREHTNNRHQWMEAFVRDNQTLKDSQIEVSSPVSRHQTLRLHMLTPVSRQLLSTLHCLMTPMMPGSWKQP